MAVTLFINAPAIWRLTKPKCSRHQIDPQAAEVVLPLEATGYLAGQSGVEMPGVMQIVAGLKTAQEGAYGQSPFAYHLRSIRH